MDPLHTAADKLTNRQADAHGGRLVSGTLLIIASAILLWCPLASRIEIGGDEDYELQKARLMNRGWTLYREIWNDQPPLHTWLLSRLFRLGGEQAVWGRLVSLAAALWLGWSVGYWSRRGLAGAVGAALMVALLFGNEFFFTLGISAMLEIPAMAAGMAAVCLSGWRRLPDRWAGLAAGVVMGWAAQVKMTALLYCPACLGVLWLRRVEAPGRTKWGGWLVQTGTFGLGVVSGFLAIALLWPGELPALWTHFSPRMREAFAGDYFFQWGWLTREPALLLITALFPLVATRRQWKYSLPFLLNLASTLLVLQLHRPVWEMYVLHLLLPGAILAATPVQAGWDGLCHWWARRGSPPLTVRGLAGLVALLYCLVAAPAHLVEQIRAARQPEPVLQQELLDLMRRCRAWSDRAFSVRLIYAFQAGMVTPPRTTVLPEKRVRLDPTVFEAIAEDLEQWKPGAVYLVARLIRPPIRAILDRDYELVFQDYTDLFYLRRDLGPRFHGSHGAETALPRERPSPTTILPADQ